MKKYNEILKEIDALYAEVKNAEEKQNAEIKRHFAIFDGLSFKEKIEKKRENKEVEEEHMKRIAEYQETITNGKIKLKLLQNNAKIALFNEVMPIVLKTYEKYKGKPYGEKTREKIREEIKTKTNCNVYMDNKSYRIYPRNSYEFECGTKYINGDKKPLLVDNKIQTISMDDLELYYINRMYFEDLEEVVKEMKRLHSEAKKKQEELEAICDKYNELTVDGITKLNHTSYSIKNII